MDRKGFFKTAVSGATAVTLPGMLLARQGMAQAHPETPGDHTGISPGQGTTYPRVKITGVKGYFFRKAHFVRVETDSGISGWGESDGANKQFSNLYIDEMLEQYALGRDPFDSELIWHEA